MKTRTLKKLLAALTALCLLLSFGMFSAMGALNTTMTKALASGLAFDEEGQFKILVMNDLTDGMIPYPAMIRYIEYVLEDTQPDLVVLNGDITRKAVTGFAANWSTIPWVCGLLEKAGVPFTLTFGENDAMLPMSKNHYLTNYQRYANCLAYDDVPTDAGVANHNLFVFNDAEAAAAKNLDGVAFNLWMIDSNNDGFVRTQSAWYAAKEYDAIYLRTGYIVPSILFSHLPLPEIKNVPSGKNMNTPYGGEMYRAMAPFGTMPPEIVPTEPTDIPSQTQPFVGVMAAVSGHYHTTLFDETWDNPANGYSLRFISRPSMSFLHRHGDRATRGASLITLKLIDEAIPEEIEYEYVYEFVYEFEYEYDGDVLVLDENDNPIPVLDSKGNPKLAKDGDGNFIKVQLLDEETGLPVVDDETGLPVWELKLDKDGKPILDYVIETVVAYPVAPVVEIDSVTHLPITIYFDGNAEKQAFYKAGVNWFFGPLSSLIGLCASLFADRYAITYSVNQFFGNIFGFML